MEANVRRPIDTAKITLLTALEELHQHGFQLELQERGGGYAIVLPIDGNYMNLEDAQSMFYYWQNVCNVINDELQNNRGTLYQGEKTADSYCTMDDHAPY